MYQPEVIPLPEGGALEPTAHPGGDPAAELTRALGREVFTWTSNDGSLTVTFGRPKGVIGSKIARVLGPQQAENGNLQLLYRALLAIQTRNGEPMPDLYTDSHFFHAEQWFQSDENVGSYMLAWQIAFFSDHMDMLDQARKAGESNESIQRILSQVDKLHPKA
jgi:hypothetical protein